MNQPLPIRRAARSDVAPIAAMLARAFARDPAIAWMIPDSALRARALPGLFHALVGSAIRHGHVWCTPEHDAATVWRVHDALGPTWLDRIRSLHRLVSFKSAAGPRAKMLSEAVHSHFPQEEFRYLQIAGCDPQSQGKGLGRAVVREGLEHARADGVPVYLETAREANLGFYRSLGFEQIGEYNVADGGPLFQQMMWRP